MQVSLEKNHCFSTPSLSLRSEEIATKIMQLAVQILFSTAMVWMGAALLPLTCKGLTLTALAIGSAFISASFFDPSLDSEGSCLAASVVDIEQVPVVIPSDSPRGIVREGNNCWVNSILQLLVSSKTACQWIEKGEHFPDELAPLRTFYQAYNEAVNEGRAIVRFSSQDIRKMISNLSNQCISESSSMQEDAHEGLKFILGSSFYPEIAEIEEAAYYDIENSPAMLDCLSGIRKKTDSYTDISLPIPQDPNPELNEMLNEYFHDTTEQNIDQMGTDGALHSYRAVKVERHYKSAPSEIWVHIKRFGFIRPKSPDERGYCFKNSTPIKISHEISIPLSDGSLQKYRLNCSVNHQGTYEGGHYLAYRDVGDALYCCNDRWVSLVAPENREQVRSRAYLLHYERVL